MTPFGMKLRELREEHGLNQKQLAKALHVSAAYLSALEHGRRPPPTFQFLQRVMGHFNIIWDDAEDLARLAGISDPRVTIDTAGLDPLATEVANLLSEKMRELDKADLASIKAILKKG